MQVFWSLTAVASLWPSCLSPRGEPEDRPEDASALACSVPLMTSLSAAWASEHRSRELAREFQRLYPCPSTGRASGACPGYVRDHIVPLTCGGPDAVSNLQWQTIRDARAKDAWERKSCVR
jgi:hypothetical protein